MTLNWRFYTVVHIHLIVSCLLSFHLLSTVILVFQACVAIFRSFIFDFIIFSFFPLFNKVLVSASLTSLSLRLS